MEGGSGFFFFLSYLSAGRFSGAVERAGPLLKDFGEVTSRPIGGVEWFGEGG